MATMMLRIDEVRDDGDDEALERSLRELPGVFGVVISRASGCIEVDLEDDEIDFDRVLERVRQNGYLAHLSG